ncbi:MAG: hypothetical protein WBP85_00610 [Terracidiphilus sp.]
MKIGRFALSAASLALLLIQLAIVSTVAAKYLYQRWTCPRVWTRAIAYDPELPLRGRYLELQLTVDGCQSTLPSAKDAAFPRKYDGTVKAGPYTLRQDTNWFRANLKVEDNRLVAMRIEGQENSSAGELVEGSAGTPCDQMRLTFSTDFFVSDTAQSPLPLKPNQELWIEVTVPPKGPPRPLQLALKDNGTWKPLDLR